MMAARLYFTTDFKKRFRKKKVYRHWFYGDTPVNKQDWPDVSVLYKACEKIADLPMMTVLLL